MIWKIATTLIIAIFLVYWCSKALSFYFVFLYNIFLLKNLKIIFSENYKWLYGNFWTVKQFFYEATQKAMIRNRRISLKKIFQFFCTVLYKNQNYCKKMCITLIIKPDKKIWYITGSLVKMTKGNLLAFLEHQRFNVSKYFFINRSCSTLLLLWMII